MRISLAICILWSVLSYCVSSRKNIESEQGIKGEVRWFEGNLMPTIADSLDTTQYAGQPVKREVYVYEAVKQDDAVVLDGQFFSPMKKALVTTVSTDENGKFLVKLPNGRYSIFVLEKGRLYANTFDGDNYINPVTVKPGSFTDIKISITYKAYY